MKKSHKHAPPHRLATFTVIACLFAAQPKRPGTERERKPEEMVKGSVDVHVSEREGFHENEKWGSSRSKYQTTLNFSSPSKARGTQKKFAVADFLTAFGECRRRWDPPFIISGA
jgi:hypothetical protein